MITVFLDIFAAWGVLCGICTVAFMYLVRRGKKARRKGKGRPAAHPAGRDLSSDTGRAPVPPIDFGNSGG